MSRGCARLPAMKENNTGDPASIPPRRYARQEIRPVLKHPGTPRYTLERFGTPEGPPVHPITPFARTAFAQGWAASGGPLTPTVYAGCIAALELAAAHADRPDILETVTQLGSVEGTLAAVVARQHKTHRSNQDELRAAWSALGLAGQAADVATAARQHAGQAQERAGRGFLDWIGDLVRRLFGQRVTVAAWHKLTDALQTALARAMAEGHADALALAAARQGHLGFDFDLAFEDAYQALTRAGTLSGMASVDAWLDRLLGDNAAEVGQKLSTLTRAGADYQDMVDAVSDILDGAASRAIQTGIDVLTSRALSQGALDLYRGEGVSQVDFLTAGAGACPICSALEARNPYMVGDAPLSGQHPSCRCVVVARDVLPTDLIVRYTSRQAAATPPTAEPT